MIRTVVVVFAIAAVAFANVDTVPEDSLIEAEDACAKDPHCTPPTYEDGGCTLDVAKCLASPENSPLPVWHEPVVNFGSTYNDLCAQESFVKKKQEVVTKSAEKNMKEAAVKDKYAEKKAKALEVKLKKSHEGMVKMATKVQETDQKSKVKTVIDKEIVPAPKAAPVEYKKMPEVAPAAPTAAPAAETKYTCDQTTCKCVEDKQGHAKDFCEQMCSTGPCGVKTVPPFKPSVAKKEAPKVTKFVPSGSESQVKKVLGVKESVEKTAEKNKKVRCEVEAKQTEKMNKVLASEITSKKKESVQKYTVTVPEVKVEGPLADFEQGTKKTKELLAKFGAMKEKLVKSKVEAKQKQEANAKESAKKKCTTAHRTCLEIHSASAAKDAAAAELTSKHTAKLKEDCGKTLAYEEKAAEVMRYNVCAAAAQKMKVVIGGLKKSFSTENLFHYVPEKGYGAGPSMFDKFNKETWAGEYAGKGGVNCKKPAPIAVAKVAATKKK